MEDSGYGFELYNLGESKYSILGGMNRCKTLEELFKNQYSMKDLQDQLYRDSYYIVELSIFVI